MNRFQKKLTREGAVHLRLVIVAVEDLVDAAVGGSKRDEEEEEEEEESVDEERLRR